jgi:integrase
METEIESRDPLSAQTIVSVVKLLKRVVASAKDENGMRLYRPDWDNAFIELPKVVRKKQKRPFITVEVMTGLAKYRIEWVRVLFILLAATGARIGEMLGVEIDKHISPDFRTISIEQKVYDGQVENYCKTENSYRKIDLHPAAAELLKSFMSERKSGFLFCNRKGGAIDASHLYTRHLHPALKALGYKNDFDGTHKAGFHIFRRFRNTHLRSGRRCPLGLLDFWLAWGTDDEDDDEGGGSPMSNLYDMTTKMLVNDRPTRLQIAEECGIGFELASLVPSVPNSATTVNAIEPAQTPELEEVDLWV